MKNYYFISLLLFAGNFHTVAQQKFCDLEITILSPSEGQVIPYGDTANLDYVIKNLGPDTLDLSDTIYFSVDLLPFNSSIAANLSPGDSITSTFLSTWHDTTTNDTLTFCLYIVQELNETFSDTLLVNDTACVQFILEGRATDIKLATNKPTSLRLFPNPARHKVELELVGFTPGRGSIIISNVAGKECQRLEVEVKGNTPSQKVDLDISSLPTGIYLLEFRSENTLSVSKMVVQ